MKQGGRRTRARQAVLQALYQLRLGGQRAEDVQADFYQSDFMKGVDQEHFQQLFSGVVKHRVTLNQRLAPLLDRCLDELDPIEREVLSIGLYELLHCPQIPWRVVIDESVELAKQFAGEQSYKYINGVLDRAAQEL